MRTVFLRLIDAVDKSDVLRRLAAGEEATSRQRYEIDPRDFAAVGGAPFAYWLSAQLRRAFETMDRFASEGRDAKHGGTTLDDTRFVRLWTEAGFSSLNERSFVPFAKGGPEARFYADIPTCVRWRGDGAELKANASAVRARNGWGDQWTAVLNGYDSYFLPGLTWPLRAARFSPQVLPAGCVFSARGYCIFAPLEALLATLAVCASSTFDYLFKVRLGRSGHPEFVVGVLQELPFPPIGERLAETLDALGRSSWSLKRSLDTRNEVSHAFVLPAVLQMEGDSLAVRARAWVGRAKAAETELEAIQAEVDERCFDLYGIDDADRRAISEGLAGATEVHDVGKTAGEVDEADGERDVDAAVDAAGLTAELVSWAVGVAFGRFDVRLATSERAFPAEPQPFDPLPVCSPGMLVGDDGLPLTSAPSGYPIDFPASGVLVDDPGDSRDLTAAVRAVFDRVFVGSVEGLWDEVSALLDPRGHDLRAWLRSEFFERHLKLHSKSRRKAPILWQLGTPSARYSVWLYAHRLTDDSIFQLQSDVLAPKLAYEERQLTSLVQDSGGSPSAKERREIEAQEVFVEELRVLLDEVKRVAALWKPTLDDGIVLVMAPLWRLVPHKAWQRELKKKWDELAAGKYDWAQLAMHLWPERVVPKCAADRSLAIAHGLEDVFWAEDGDEKWKSREEPIIDVVELIQQRTSIAAKNALQDLPQTAASAGSARAQWTRGRA